MAGPTIRVLALLELLQSHGRLSGAELAERLGVERRTVRRYIRVLEDLGIPLTAEQGRNGGYMLVAGYKLPPMMFTNEEVLAIALGLLAVRESGLLEDGPALESVQAKLERVMPAALKHRVRSVRENTRLVLERGSDPRQREVLLGLTEAAESRRTVSMDYTSRQGERMRREIDPYGLVFRWGHWYVSGYCHLREDLRSFRLDRLANVEPLPGRFERPADFNAAEHLQDSMQKACRQYDVEVWLYTDMASASRHLGSSEAVLQQGEGGLLLSTRTDSYSWFAWWLAQLPCDFSVVSPDELKAAVRKRGERLLRSCG
ncbi:helix-turn-helix transcriptional regulator [Parahaliea mediterranea]|uniref:YafY family transcriptional regulator n=1 Tax=Parahaliea mediterranea TaxID=651086 RepID=A0A939DC44_9GAMM|nr:YafY family protein [Parahaliea mediterranea]MBN7795309.1 YafY family transcriptional regulator [Parahaliea mediterranea]